MFEIKSDRRVPLDGLGDARLRRRLGQCGRAVVDEEFSVDTMVARYHDLYTRLLDPGSSVPSDPIE